MSAQSVVIRAQTLSPFPPSFEDNPWTYGFALFSLTLVSALGLAMLLQFWFDWRVGKLAADKAMNLVSEPVPFATPLTVHRLIIAGFLFTILLGALPDVIVLLFWGEATPQTMERLFLVDRLGDGLTVFPFTIAVMLSAWGLQVIPQALVRETQVLMKRPTWATVRDKVKIVPVVLLLAVGVTLAKAHS